jgi:hypothetical protein
MSDLGRHVLSLFPSAPRFAREVSDLRAAGTSQRSYFLVSEYSLTNKISELLPLNSSGAPAVLA